MLVVMNLLPLMIVKTFFIAIGRSNSFKLKGFKALKLPPALYVLKHPNLTH